MYFPSHDYLIVSCIITGPPGGMGGMTCPDGSPRLPRHEVDPDNPGDPPGCPAGRDGDGDGSGDDDGAGTAVSTVGIIAAMNVIVQIIVHVHELIWIINSSGF